MNSRTEEVIKTMADEYNIDISNTVVKSNDETDEADYLVLNNKLYTVYKDSTSSPEEIASYIYADFISADEDKKIKEYLDGEDSWLLNCDKQEISEDVKDDNMLQEKYTTSQAKILDELSYLISTEYEAIKWYDEAVPMIQASGMDEDLISSTVLGIEEIRKDEEDHIAHLEHLMTQIKENKLIDGTNGDE